MWRSRLFQLRLLAVALACVGMVWLSGAHVGAANLHVGT